MKNGGARVISGQRNAGGHNAAGHGGFRMSGSGGADGASSGILLMLVAFMLFSVLDASAKHLVQWLPATVVVFGRYALGTLFIVLIGWPVWKGAMWRTASLRLQLLRGVFMVGATLLNFLAVRHLQLAQTSAILFTTPLWVCLFSPFLLGEHVGWRRWLAVLAGFAGVLLVLRPGTSAFHPAMFYSLAAALTLSFYQILTRRVGLRDAAISSLLWSTAAGAALSLPLALASPAWPQGSQWFFLALAGLAGSAGHFLLAEAHRRADASLLAPFAYSQLVWMMLIGWLWFGDIPDAWTVAGALIVAAAGSFVFHRERLLARKDAKERPHA
jgi:drug/metabolite transporter (DMT)-like permease